MARSKKKEPSLYDENGRWVQERNRIKGSIRRAFRLSPQMKEVLQKARVELPPALKKDGTPGKRPQVRYRCAGCGELFSQKNVQADHIDTVVPLWKKEKDMSYDDIVRGIFCSTDNLQVLCSTPMRRNNGLPSCHKKKTDKENWLRKRFEESEDLKSKKCLDKIMKQFEKEYEEHLIEKENKKNARKKRQIRKRKSDT